MIIHTCKICNFSTHRKNMYDKHILTQKHIKNTNLNSNYICILCNFSTTQKTAYNTHLLTQKHKRNYKDTQQNIKIKDINNFFKY